MTLQTPTTQEISDNIIANFENAFGVTIPTLDKAFLRVVAKTDSGIFVLLWRYCGFIALQQFVTTASDQPTTINGVTITPLTEFGRLTGVGDPIPATAAVLNIEIDVITQVGNLPAGTQLFGQLNNVTYITQSTIALDAATKTVDVLAVNDQAGGDGAGEIGNLEAGDVLTFANPLANVQRDAEVLSQVVTGADAETTASYRQRVLDRFQKRPQGGALIDYEQWGEEVAGIANIYPYTGANPGEVDVYVESATETDGIPTTAQLNAVFDSIEFDQAGLASRRPANAAVNVYSITRTTFDVRITSLIVDNPATVQTQINDALTEYFLNAAPFIDGLSVPPRVDRITANEVGGLVQEIVSAAGGVFGVAIISVGAVDQSLYNLGIGEKAKLGTVTYV